MSASPYVHNSTSRLNAFPTPPLQPQQRHHTPDVWFDGPQFAILQQIKHTMGPAGYGRIRVPARYHPPVDRGPNTYAVIKSAVASNSPIALSSELLEHFDSVAGYHRAVLYGSIDRLIKAINNSLKLHSDPPMFILQALIGIGQIIKTRVLERDLEMVVSKFLLEVLRAPLSLTPPSDIDLRFVGDESYSNSGNGNRSDIDMSHGSPLGAGNDHQSSIITSSSSSTHIASTIASTVTITSPPLLTPKSNLILWSDDHPIDHEASDSDLNEEGPCLVDFTNSLVNTRLVIHDTPYNNAAVHEAPCKSTDTDNDIVFINLSDLQPSPAVATNHRLNSTLVAPSLKIRARVKAYSASPPPPIDPLNRHFLEQHILYTQKVNRQIQPRHHQELLNAILAQQCPLQIFLAIDTFDLEPILLTPLIDTSAHELLVDDDSNRNYASLLAIQLIELGYLNEATALLLRCSSGRSHPIDVKLLAGLVAQNKHELIHTVIGDNKNLCRSALHSIDRRMAAHIWTWVSDGIIDSIQLDHFHVLQCMRANILATTATFTNLDPDSPTAFSALDELVATAIKLAVKFELDNTMKTLQSLKFLSDFRTVASLLPQQQHRHQPLPSPPETPPRSSPPASSYYPPGPNPTAETTANDDPSPFSSLAGSEYHLTRRWRFLPFVLEILNGNSALQRLVIWYGVRNYPDSSLNSPIGYLASKLGLRPYFDQCLQNVKVRARQLSQSQS
ncbi:hypothetical protein BGW39_005431 [Mortierella sp. 14UC]|nr:hypothetical protein BGW39_005431 [Mortierella sp. 14UC]